MCSDGKNVTAGLDDEYGDVDMFEFEYPPTLDERKERMHKEVAHINDLRSYDCEEANKQFDEDMLDSKKRDIIDMLRAVLIKAKKLKHTYTQYTNFKTLNLINKYCSYNIY